MPRIDPMDATRFDRLSKRFAQRRARHALAQEATPAPADIPGGRPELLFVQTYQSGTITPIDGVEGRYTLTLAAGTGQTVYFSDRPNRLVGADPTPQVLEALGFPDDNPPNAALVVETAPGETDVAVVELFNPLYDPINQGVTYEVEVLANWQTELDLAFSEAPTDLAALVPSFGSAHLFIDGLLDCPQSTITCWGAGVAAGKLQARDFCSRTFFARDSNGVSIFKTGYYCVPCETPSQPGAWDGWFEGDYVWRYWGQKCNETFSECGGNCLPFDWCRPDPYYQKRCDVYA
jgi:hypothetical protein